MADEDKGELEQEQEQDYTDIPEDIEVLIADSKDDGAEVDPEFKDLSKAEIIAKLKAVEAKVATPPAVDMAKLEETLGKLASRPVNVTQTPPPPPAPKAPTKEELVAKYGERFVTDPISVILELQEMKNSPQTAKDNGANLVLARKLLELDPKTSVNFAKFAPQIDALVANAPAEAKNNPLIYEQAYKMVIAQNVDAVVDEKVAAKVSELVEAELKKRGLPTKPTQGDPKPVSHAETRGTARPTKTVTVRVDPARAERLAKLGMDVKEVIAAEQAVRGKK